MRRFIHKRRQHRDALAYYSQVQAICGRYGIKILYEFRQETDLDLKAIGEEGGACFGIVGLFTKYMADQLDRIGFSHFHAAVFFRRFQEYFDMGVDAFLSRSMKLQPARFYNEELEDFLAPKLYADVHTNIHPVKNDNGQIITEYKRGQIVENIEGQTFTYENEVYWMSKASQLNICRTERTIGIYFNHTKYYVDPTFQSIVHNDRYYMKKESIHGMVTDLVNLNQGCDFNRFNIAALTIANLSHAVCLVYDKRSTAMYFFDPNYGVMQIGAASLIGNTSNFLNAIFQSYSKDKLLEHDEKHPIILCDFFTLMPKIKYLEFKKKQEEEDRKSA